MNKYANDDLIHSCVAWFNSAKPNPTQRNAITQLGVFFEEVSEVAEAFRLFALATEIKSVANCIKAGLIPVYFPEDGEKRELQIDGLVDTIVTAVGTLTYIGADAQAAFHAVLESNWSKFDDEGSPILDANGKILKGPDYKPPQFSPEALGRLPW